MSDRPRSGDEIDKAAMTEQRGYFARHQIRSRSADGTRWELWCRKGDAWEGNLWCEIAVLANNTLLVHGDFEPCMWSARRDETDAYGTVRWIGRQTGLDYVRDKAALALGGSELTEEQNAEALRFDILRHLETCDEDDLDKEDREAFVEAADDLDGNSDDECARVLADLLDEDRIDSETASAWGRVTTSRVIRAQAAVARLYELLRAERGE